ncbi:MAG: tetratricopeptide repeat protein [Victivallales bacterium]|nr:tetratricopeptide repeat protein [Victivallales bacterium]
MRLFLTFMLLAAILSAKDSAALLRRGNAACADGKFDDALKFYDEALVESPENPHLIFNRAVALFRKGEFDKAKEAFQSSIDKLPNLKRADSDLECRARTAIGDCCFTMAKPIVDSETDGALKLCLESISSYEGALRLNPKAKEAAKNIVSARMLLKKILGIKYAQAQQQKQQQELASKIKELAERQKAAADNTAKGGDSQDNESLVKEQDEISRDTEELAGKIQPQQPQQPQQMQQQPQSQDAPENPMKQARDAQDAASEKLRSKDFEEAEKQQRLAAEKLEEMLKQNEQQQNQKQQKQDGQQNSEQDGQEKSDEQKQDGDSQKQEQEKQGDGSDEQEPQEQKQQAAEETEKKDDASEQEANEIIDRERHDKRERDKNRRGSYRAVPMDW